MKVVYLLPSPFIELKDIDFLQGLKYALFSYKSFNKFPIIHDIQEWQLYNRPLLDDLKQKIASVEESFIVIELIALPSANQADEVLQLLENSLKEYELKILYPDTLCSDPQNLNIMSTTDPTVKAAVSKIYDIYQHCYDISSLNFVHLMDVLLYNILGISLIMDDSYIKSLKSVSFKSIPFKKFLKTS